jgi:hypothetical protein
MLDRVLSWLALLARSDTAKAVTMTVRQMPERGVEHRDVTGGGVAPSVAAPIWRHES